MAMKESDSVRDWHRMNYEHALYNYEIKKNK